MLIFFTTFVLLMSLNTSIPNNLLKKKLVTLLFITFSVASFATLGDGGKKNAQVGQSKNLLATHASSFNFKSFSLKSGYNYRGNSLFNVKNDEKFIMLNTVITYQ